MRETIIPTNKQFDAIEQIMSCRNVVLTGGARAGKTFSILLAIPWLVVKHKEENCVIAAKTLANIERNLLSPMRVIYGANNVSRIINKQDVVIFGKTFWCIPFNDESSADRLQGTSIGLAILDEIVLAPKSYYLMLRTRLDQPFSQLLCTCNPENANHYVKTDLIDNPDIKSKFVQHWTLYDNREHLSPEVITDFENAFKRSPTFYRRMILGEWCSADGLACFNFDRVKHFKKLEELQVDNIIANGRTLIYSIDPANANDMTGGVPILFGVDDRSTVLRRFAHDPKTSKALSNVEQIGLIRHHIEDLFNDDKVPIKKIYGLNKIMLVDCAGADMFIQLCYEFEPLGWTVIKMTKKDIKQTLDIMNNIFATNKCTIVDYNDGGVYDYTLMQKTYQEPLINELQSVRIRDRKTGLKQTIELNPEDPNDTFDAFRYAIAYYYKVEDIEEDV